MQTNLNKSQAPEVNITKTGYRALFILMKLIEKPLSRDEILECLSADPIAKKRLFKRYNNKYNQCAEIGRLYNQQTHLENRKQIYPEITPFWCYFDNPTGRSSSKSAGEHCVYRRLGTAYLP